ncbi:MAG: hypothetical protein SLRJCFUN_002518 [Candidatus Fervidibacter sp.]
MTPMLRWWLMLTLWVAVRWLLPFVPVPSWLLSVVALIALLLSVAWLLWLAKEAGRLWSPLPALLGSAIALLGWVGLMRLLPMFKSSLWLGLGMAVRDGCLLMGALLLGTAGARLIRHANLLPPIAVVVTVMDIWTVLLGGFVHKVQQKAPKVVEAASVAVPLPAAATKAASIALPLVGVGDWFFAAFFFALLWRFGLNLRTSYWLATVLVAAVLAGLSLRVAWLPLALPGLPFLALAVLLPNWRFFRYTAEEKRALAVGALFLLLLLALFTYAARQIR